MNLKTLKDFVGEDGELKGVVFEEELKAEAVKWVKYYKKQMILFDNKSSQYWCFFGRADSLKDFFNLTEEDLE